VVRQHNQNGGRLGRAVLWGGLGKGKQTTALYALNRRRDWRKNTSTQVTQNGHQRESSVRKGTNLMILLPGADREEGGVRKLRETNKRRE